MRRSVAVGRTSVRILGVLAVTGLTLIGLGAPAGARSLMAATAVSSPQGGTITFAGVVSPSASCPITTPVQLTSTPASGTTNLFPGGLGPTASRDAGGNFHATFVIPLTTPVGSYTIGLKCGGATVGISETLTVTAAAHVAPSITVSPASAPPGATITIAGAVPTAGTVVCPSGDAAQPTSTAALFPPDGFGPQATRDANGNFRVSYKIPATTAAGSYTIGVRCGGGNVGITATLHVTATTASTTTSTAPPPTLPPTVSSTTTIVPVPTTASIAATTTTPGSVPAKSTTNNHSLRWVALGVLLLVVLVGVVVLSALRGRAGPSA